MARFTMSRYLSLTVLALSAVVLLSRCGDLIWVQEVTVSANRTKDFNLCVHKALSNLSGYSIDDHPGQLPGLISVSTPLVSYNDEISCEIIRLGSGDIRISFSGKRFSGESAEERDLITPLLHRLVRSISGECG